MRRNTFTEQRRDIQRQARAETMTSAERGGAQVDSTRAESAGTIVDGEWVGFGMLDLTTFGAPFRLS